MVKDNSKERHLIPAIILVLLAPVMGELISGSAPPAEYFQPVSLLIFTLLYGMGALVIRETVRRWGGGWLSILLLGFAYGIFEEGIVVHSFFDPTWMDLGVLATYGRWAGVNWIWTIALTIFHGVVSISLPIALTEMLFPQVRNSRWLKPRGYIMAIFFFSLNIILAPWFVQQYSIAGYFVSAIGMLVLFIIAKKISGAIRKPLKPAPLKSARLTLLGFLMMLGLVAGMWILPGLSIPWPVTFLFLCALPWFAAGWLRKNGVEEWEDGQRWALIFGLILPWLLLTVISELDNGNRPDDTSGMIVSAITFSIFLIGLRMAAGRREKEKLSTRIDKPL